MSRASYRHSRNPQIYAQLIASISVLIILYFVSLYTQINTDLIKKLSFLSMSIYIIIIPILIALFMIISPIDIILLSTPSLVYSIYLIYSRSNIFSNYLSLFGDQLLSTTILLITFFIIILRYRATLRPINFYRDLNSLKNFFIFSINKEVISDVIIFMGAIILILAFLEIITRVFLGAGHIFLSYTYLSGALVSTLFLAKGLRRHIYYLLIATLSWFSLPLIYVVYIDTPIERRSIFTRREIINDSLVYIQNVLLDRGKMYIDLSTGRSPHILIVGATGSGKTQMSKRICGSLSSGNISTIIIDPHNEYMDLGFRRYGIREVTGLILREISSSRESIEEFIDILRISFRLGPLQIAVLSDTLLEYFQEYRDFSGLLDFIEKKIIDSSNNEIQRALRSIQFYIRLLLENIPQRINELAHESIDLDKSLIIDLSYVTKNQFITEIYIYFLLRHIWSRVREKGFSEKIRYYIVIDEAHNLLSGKVSELILRIIRESRKFGLGIILVSQLIDQRIKEFFGNIGSLIIMKTLDKETLDFIESSTRVDISLATHLKDTEFIYIDLYKDKFPRRGRIIFE